MSIKTRIAPSPTGDPHVGTAYVGLFNYVFTKQQGGSFILRIEDTDQARYNETSERRILEMMGWLGLNPDEGPHAGGPSEPYRQSERKAIYKKYADELLEQGALYRAFETSEELASIREVKGGYDGRARDIPKEESDKRAEDGEPFVLRLRTPDEGETSFHDELRGVVRVPNSELRDAVMVKSDGFPTYHFAVVVDDHLMGVTHVVRGEDWIVSTPLHVTLYEAFGWDAPKFAHLPLLRNADKTRLSKRKNDTSVDSYREQGILPEALLNYLGTMGWSMPDGHEFFDLEDMIDNFSFNRVSLGGPVFDLKKLRFFNAKYLRDILSLEEVAERVEPLLKEKRLTWEDEDYLLDVIDVLRPRAETLMDFTAHDYFFRDDFTYSPDAKKKIAGGQTYLQDMEGEFARLDSYDVDSVDDTIRDYVQSQSVGMGKVMQPLRAALTGKTNAPSVTDLVSVLGRQRVMARIGRALTTVTDDLPDDKPEKPQKDEKKDDEKKEKREKRKDDGGAEGNEAA